MFDRPGLPFDHITGPFANEQAAAAANGGKALVGAPQCSTQPCPDAYAAVSFSVAEVSAGANAPATRKDAGGKPAQAKDKPAAKPPGNEQADKEYVQHLNKALDQMLSK